MVESNYNDILDPEIIFPHYPPWNSKDEIGYVLASGSEAVRIGDSNNKVLAMIPVKYRKGIRLGDPLVIFDYLEGELFGAVVTEIANPDLTRDRLEASLFERFIPTQDLLMAGRLEFLEQPSIIELSLFCSIDKEGNKGPVDYTPHPRASLFKPDVTLIQKMFGLPRPEEGVSYGTLLLGRKPYISQDIEGNFRYLPYIMKEHLLYEHELVCGTTGKGKTVRNKNDVKQWVDRLNGAVIILDKHGEYESLTLDPIHPLDPEEQKIIDDSEMKIGRIEDVKVVCWTESKPKVSKPHTNYFTISFADVDPADLHLYLPDLSPQGYIVLPKLVQTFKSSSLIKNGHACPTLANFASWLRNAQIPNTLADERTIGAIARRLSLTLEQKIFDGLDLEDVKVEDFLVPGRVSVIPLYHIKDDDVLSIIAFHIINAIARYKLSSKNVSKLSVSILVDEAHNFFPRMVSSSRRGYVKRLVRRARIICKEGRKFKLRLQFTTQRPEEIDPGVLSIVNTITFFGMTPQQVTTLKRYIELPVAARQLINLPKRHTLIYSKDNTDQPLSVLVPWPTIRHPVRLSHPKRS
ncbi:MAG: ATP-binding protein [Candidatus Hodarchaeota archaeon]